MLKSTLIVVLAFVATTYAAAHEERAAGKWCYDDYGHKFPCSAL